MGQAAGQLPEPSCRREPHVLRGPAAAGLKPIGIFSHFYFTADRGISKAFKEWSNEGAGTIAESNKDSPRRASSPG